MRHQVSEGFLEERWWRKGWGCSSLAIHPGIGKTLGFIAMGNKAYSPSLAQSMPPLNNEVNICQPSLFPLPWRTKALPHPDVLKYIQNMSCSICFTQRQPKAPCTLACLQAHLPMSLASWCASHVHAHTHTHWTAPGTLTLCRPSASLTCIDTLHV